MALLQLLSQSDIILTEVISHYPLPFLVSLFLLSLLILFTRTTRSPPSSAKLRRVPPPSPRGLPLLGNLRQLGTNFHRSLHALSGKYGPVMLIHMGRAPVLVVSSSEAAKELVKRHDVAISNRPVTRGAIVLFYGCKNMGFAPYGEYWKQSRRVTAQELLSPKRVQQFQSVREEETSRLVEGIRRKAFSDDNCKLSATTHAINLSQFVLWTANSIVSRCVVGQSFAAEAEDGQNEAAELVKKVIVQATATFGVGDYVPCLSWIDSLTGFTGRLWSTFKEVDSFLEKVVEDREALVKSSSVDDDDDEFYLVDVLLRLQKDGSCEFELTRDNIKAFILDMLVGGTDSTSVVLDWLMAELIRNPRMMKRAQEEVRRVVGKKPKIDMNDINHMGYLKCVIKETLRLHPPAPLLVHREISEDIEIGGYHVPAKTRLFISAWAIQRDPNFWERPEEFFPERFENSAIDFKGHDFELIPFGCGRRGCPGMAFGVASIEYITANLLYWFDWKLPGGDH